MRKLTLLFDGTWNNEKTRTNVVRMKEAIVSSGEDDPEQPCFYDTGVGTHWWDRFSGAAFGRGLSANIRDGYRWLAGRFQPGDEIYVFGFSRGAYTARSLVGLIRKCGVPRTADLALIERAYEMYRNKDIAPNHRDAVAFRTNETRETRVKFIGVWDTVGALGIPVSHVPFSRDYYKWHDTALSKIVDYAYHAVAVDENREDYEVAIWTELKPENIEVEQRWFTGAHANVGGGYDKAPPDTLPNLSLRWMQDKAAATGLKLHARAEVGAQDHLAAINDSFKEFMFGAYRVFKNRHARQFGRGVNESVDPSVWRRWKEQGAYRPDTLGRHPEKPAG